jgi:DNA-binding transcriptional ArsR family regulator
MPVRATASRELADLFGALSSPHRVRILEELRQGEVDVNGLQIALGISHSAVSQHLAVLRAHRLVAERRDGRRVYYHLTQPAMADWILQGLDFIEADLSEHAAIREAVEEARRLWMSHPPKSEELS